MIMRMRETFILDKHKNPKIPVNLFYIRTCMFCGIANFEEVLCGLCKLKIEQDAKEQDINIDDYIASLRVIRELSNKHLDDFIKNREEYYSNFTWDKLKVSLVKLKNK